MATKTITQFTTGSAADLTGAAWALFDDAGGHTRKHSLATLRTKMFAGGTGYTATDPITVGTVTSPTGSNLLFGVNGGTVAWFINTSGHILSNSTNGFDIGGSSNLVRDVFIGGAVKTVGGIPLIGVDANSVIQLGQSAVIGVAVPRWNQGALAANSAYKGIINMAADVAGTIVFFDGVTGARYKLVGTAF